MTGEPEARRALDSIVGEAEDKIGRTATSMIFGKVLSSDPVAGTAVVALNGETSGTPGIKALRGYVPQAGEGVVLLKKGRQYVVLGSTKKQVVDAIFPFADQILAWGTDQRDPDPDTDDRDTNVQLFLWSLPTSVNGKVVSTDDPDHVAPDFPSNIYLKLADISCDDYTGLS